MNSGRPPINQLYILRYLACLWIVAYHYRNAFPATSSGHLELVIAQANLALLFLFVLSGFTLTVKYHNQSVVWKDFLARRLARIYPLHMLSVILWLVVILAINYHPQISWNIILQFFALDAWFPRIAQQYNYPVWASSVFLFFYCLFPWLIKLSRMRLSRSLSITGGLWLLNLAIFIIGWRLELPFNLLFYPPIMKLGQLVIGMAAGLLFCRYRHKESRLLSTALLLSGFIAIAGTVIAQHNSLQIFGRTYYDLIPGGLLAPAVACLILGFALDRSKITRLMSHSSLVFLGQISFGMYLLQEPLWIFYAKLLRHNPTSFQLVDLAVFVMMLTLAASLIHRFFDQPIQRWLESIYKKPSPTS